MKKIFRLYLESYKDLSTASWMLALVMFINRCGAMVLPFLGIYMTNELHLSLKDAGTVLSFYGIGAIAGSLLGGWLTDKAGHFKIQMGSMILAIPMYFILPSFRSAETLAGGIFLLSLITETLRPANSVAIMHYARPENLTKSFSLNRMALNLGFSIGPAIGGVLAAFSYHLLFYGNGISAILAGLLFYFYFRNRKGIEQAVVQNDPEVITFPARKFSGSPYRDGPFLIFCLLCCFYSICFFQLLSTLPLFYRDVHLLNEKNIGLILASNGAAVVLLEMLLVQISERRLGVKASIVIGTVFCALAFALLNVTGMGGHWILFVSMFALSISEILAMPFMATLAVSRSAGRNKGAYMGLNALTFSIAHIFSPLLGTRVAEAHGFTFLWWGTALVALLTALGLYLILKKM